MATDDGRFHCCPLCQGKGQVHRSELIERLSDPQLTETQQLLLDQLKQAEQQDLAAVSPDNNHRQDFDREVHSWPPRRILWRRSPKE